MTSREFQAFVKPFETEDNESRFGPMSRTDKQVHARAKRGRPAKAVDEKSVKVMLSMPPALLAKTDAYAKKIGTTRAGLVQAALIAAMRDRLKPAS